MSKQTYVETLVVAYANGPIVNSTATTYFSLLPSHAKYTFPAGYFDTPGKTIRVTAAGVMTTGSNATARDIIFVANMNNINVFNSSNVLITATTNTIFITGSWFINLTMTCVQVGNTTTANNTAFTTIGHLSYSGQSSNASAVANSLFNINTIALPSLSSVGVTSPGLTVDAQSANVFLDFGCVWSTAAQTNFQIVLTDYILEALN